MTVADQRATQKMLYAALAVIRGFYDTKAAAALVMKWQSQTSPRGCEPRTPSFGLNGGRC